VIIKDPPSASGIYFPVGVTVKLMKKLNRIVKFHCHHPGLVPVVSRPPVTIPELLCQRYLNYFLTIAEDPEFCFSRQDFTTAYDAQITADMCQAEIRKYLITV